ncbi:MAG: HupE/UreJ family protein [Deltaproteobacteria bacterium]|nr:HupE/UreJ family protein [Deltaproteobacteria bacterium]MBP7285495.1 HupE/UreJ family protein [Nannocystaceae bacterium]
MGHHVEQRTRTTPAVARLLAPFALALVGAAMPVTAQAHMGSKKTITVVTHDAGATLDVTVDAVDAAVALGLPASASHARLLGRETLVRGWLAGGITVSSDGGRCRGTAAAPEITAQDGRDALRVRIEVACPEPATGLRLRDETVFAEDPDHETFVAMAGGTGDVLRGERREIALATAPSAWRTATAFVREGAVHLVTGYDHLLFLLSLVLSAGVLARREGLRRAARDVAWVVTAFTLGHSISLVLAALGVVSLPSQLVESAIAASIIAVAALNVARPQARVAKPWIAGAFGIVHGFGFSSVLADVGLPASHRAVALASFNVGIELAQLVFVTLVMLPLVWAAHHRRYQTVVVRGGSLAIAACGCVWLVERGLGL